MIRKDGDSVRSYAQAQSNGRSVRFGIVPLFQVYPVFVSLFSLNRSFPGLISLLGVLPVGLLARIIAWINLGIWIAVLLGVSIAGLVVGIRG